MESKKKTVAGRFGIEKRVFAAKICCHGIANGLTSPLHALAVDGWIECGAC